MCDAPRDVEMNQMDSPGERLDTIAVPSNNVPPAMLNLGRRDSNSSVKSLRSYHTVRESLGKMHAYVERVSKLDQAL
jgi:hypothetical protein